MLNNAGIYLIRNLVGNKIYVGSTNDLDRRKDEHFSKLRRNKHNNPHLQYSFNKYGEENFIFEIISYESVNSIIEERQLRDKEIWLINFLDEDKRYNVVLSATNPMYGRTHSEETKRKMSESQLGNKNNLGKKRSLETKEKISAVLKGRIFSDDHCKNISNAKKGTIVLDATREKMSKSRIGLHVGSKHPNFGKRGKNHPSYEKQHSEEYKEKLRTMNLCRSESISLISDNGITKHFTSTSAAGRELNLDISSVSKLRRGKLSKLKGWRLHKSV